MMSNFMIVVEDRLATGAGIEAFCGAPASFFGVTVDVY